MAANIVKGSKLMLFLGGTAIACATSHTLSISIDTTESALDVPEGGWTPKANTGYKGKAIITSLELSAPDGENATFSVNLQGTGALDPVTA